MFSIKANHVQVIEAPENLAWPSSQAEAWHDTRVLRLAAVLLLFYSFTDSTCGCIAFSQLRQDLPP